MLFRLLRRSLGIAALILAAMAVAGGPAQAQKRGGTFIIGLEGEPSSLVAHLATDTSAAMVAANVFSGLITTDLDFNPRPDLAQRWEESPDGLTYTFYLDPKAKWHDGKPVTADDVEFTFNEVIAKVHPRASSWWPNVVSAKATGPQTFVIKLKSPYAPFLTLLASHLNAGTLIVPKHVYAGTDPKTNPANQKPVGSGAFKFVKWEKGSHVELVRNDAYFKPGLPYLDRIVVQFLPDPSARMLAFEKGDVDFLHWYIVPHDQVARLRKDPRFQIIPHGGEGAATNGFLLFNTRLKELGDVRVRQAIAYAVDLEEVKNKAMFGEGKVAHSHVSSGIGWAFKDNDVYGGKQTAKANALLDEAGFRRGADGKRFALRLYWATGRDYEGRAAEVIRDHLKDVGIDVTVSAFDRPTFIDRVFKQWDFDLANQLFTTGPDPTLSIPARYHSNQIQKVPFVNGMGYSNPELDKLFDTEYTLVDRTKRANMWAEIQKILMRDLPALPLYEIPIVNAASAKFKNVIDDPFGYIQSRERTYLAE